MGEQTERAGLGEVFAARLKMLLKEHNFTQADLARYLEVDPATVSRYMSGRIPPAETLFEIASRFEVGMDWLMGGSGRVPGEAPSVVLLPLIKSFKVPPDKLVSQENTDCYVGFPYSKAQNGEFVSLSADGGYVIWTTDDASKERAPVTITDHATGEKYVHHIIPENLDYPWLTPEMEIALMDGRWKVDLLGTDDRVQVSLYDEEGAQIYPVVSTLRIVGEGSIGYSHYSPARVPVLGHIKFGGPLFDEGNVTRRVEAPGYLAGVADFALIVGDDALAGMGIEPGDIAFMAKPAGKPRRGDIVAVVVDGSLTLRLYQDAWLDAANKKYQQISMDELGQVEIVGIYKGLLLQRPPTKPVVAMEKLRRGELLELLDRMDAFDLDFLLDFVTAFRDRKAKTRGGN